MIPEVELRVELRMTNPPQPVGFGVSYKGNIIGLLTREKVVEALTIFDSFAKSASKKSS